MDFNISPPKNITNLFGNWLMGVNKKERAETRVGRYKICAMIIFLTERNKILLCRLSHWPQIESIRGPSYNQRTSDKKCILGATG
jgi:hypothetical protein